MITLTYRASKDSPWTRIEISEDKDPFEVCNFVRDRLFPWELVPVKDARFDAVMKARKKRTTDA